MFASRLFSYKSLLTTIVNRWPLAVVIFGLALTLLWLILLVWFALRLLKMV